MKRLDPRPGGQVFIHQRRNRTEPGAVYVVAVVPAYGARWESAPIADEDRAETAAQVLADFCSAEIRR
jgi:hypothetical protein